MHDQISRVSERIGTMVEALALNADWGSGRGPSLRARHLTCLRTSAEDTSLVTLRVGRHAGNGE